VNASIIKRTKELILEIRQSTARMARGKYGDLPLNLRRTGVQGSADTRGWGPPVPTVISKIGK